MTVHVSAASIFGLLGNIVSGMVFLAPVSTFYSICKRKCTDGFQSFPYLVALFSATLWIYYAILKGFNGDNLYLITINSVGCCIESTYVILFIIYAPKKVKICTYMMVCASQLLLQAVLCTGFIDLRVYKASTIKLLMLMNIGALCSIIIPTLLLFDGVIRLKVLGWICAVFAVSVSAAPLSIMRLVVRTKSVEFMPFFLSLFLTLSNIMWFGYGLLIKDPFVEYPNVLGMLLGSAQMILYGIYKRKERDCVVTNDTTTGVGSEVYPVIDVQPGCDEGSKPKDDDTMV